MNLKTAGIILFSAITFLAACHDNKKQMTVVSSHDEMIKWIDQFKTGTDINDIKAAQPANVSIDWQHPIKEGGNKSIRYAMKLDSNTNNVLMTNFLFFTDNKFKGRVRAK